MEENENKTTFNVNAEDVKKETEETVNQVKDTIKNVDLKNDSKEAKGFFFSFFKNPLGEIKKSASSVDNKFVKIAIIIFVVWIAILLISNILSMATTYLFGPLGNFAYFFQNLFHNMFLLVKTLVAPIITILVLSGLVYGFKKVKNRSFLTIISTILIAKVPIVIANTFNLLVLVNSHFTKITSAFSGFCNVLSTVFLFFAVKSLLEEDKNDSYFWKFALIIGIFYIVKFVCSYLGIYL